MISLRLRFWLLMMDLAGVLGYPRRFWLWTVGKAGAATDYGTDGACDGSDVQAAAKVIVPATEPSP